MNNQKEEKLYTNSKGETIKMSELNGEHLINSYSKKYREVFSTNNQDEYFSKINELKDLQEEIYKRFNDYSERFNDGNKSRD